MTMHPTDPTANPNETHAPGANPARPDATVVIPTYNRIDFFEQYAASGFWEGAPVLLVDDGSEASVAARMDDLAKVHGFEVHHNAKNEGVAFTIGEGIRRAKTSKVVVVGDDDYCLDLDGFLREGEAIFREDPEALLVAMPYMYAFNGERQYQQYNRNELAGMTGREVLAMMVAEGEMRAMGAGVLFNRVDLLDILPEPFFRMANDFAMLARLCAKYPDRRVRVASRGKYMRLLHDQSITAAKGYTPEKVATHLVSLIVGAHYLMETGALTLPELIEGIVRRGGRLKAVYGVGEESAALFTALLEGRTAPCETPETVRVAAFLHAQREALPPEFGAVVPEAHRRWLGDVAASEAVRLGGQGEQARLHHLVSIFDHLNAGAVEEAKAAVARHKRRFPDDRDLPPVEASVALLEGDGRAAERVLAACLAREPEHFTALLMLGNLYLERGAHQRAARLYTRALRLADPEQLEQIAPGWKRLNDEGITEPIVSPKIAFIVREDLDQFLDDILRELAPDYEVRKFRVKGINGVEAAMEWADVCWFEWCNEPLIHGSALPMASEKKIVCRLHRYEAFTNFPTYVRWKNVDRLMLVTEHLSHLLEGVVFRLHDRVAIEVVQNGVNLEDYPFRERERGFNLAYVGYIHLRKNPMMLLQVMARLVAEDPRYRLFVAGTFQDQTARLYWEYMVRRMNLQDHVHLDGWQSDIAAWLEDKNYLLSTSIHESFGYAIAESMARGLKPVVHNFPFANEIWAEEMLFDTVEEAVEMITSPEYDSATYRAFIEGHYSLEKQMAKIRSILASLTAAPAGPDREPKASSFAERVRLRTAV